MKTTITHIIVHPGPGAGRFNVSVYYFHYEDDYIYDATGNNLSLQGVEEFIRDFRIKHNLV